MPVKRDDEITFSETLVLDPYTYAETKKRNAQVIYIIFIISSRSLFRIKETFD